MPPVVIGVDLGGTNVRAARVSSDGAISCRVELPSRAREGAHSCIAAVAEAIRAVADNEIPAEVGIGIPGHIDALRGVIKWAPNFGEVVGDKFQHFVNVPFYEILFSNWPELREAKLAIGNDANVAALGEYKHGSGKGSKGFALITLGTGIGSGIILAPECVFGDMKSPSVVIGKDGGAVEYGHICIVAGGRLCGCGARGCFEAYCGTQGLLAFAEEAGAPSTTPLDLFEKAERGEEGAVEAWRRYGWHLGVGLGSLCNIFSVERVAIGGQIAKAHKHFLEATKASVAEHTIESILPGTTIAPAELIDDAGILGAAALCELA